MKIVKLMLLLGLAAVVSAKYAGPQMEGLVWGMETEANGWGPENVTQHSGYIAVNKKVDNGGHIFYWMFESRGDPANDPLVLWMTGGPGCSSELAIFTEQGPYRFDEDGNLYINDKAWNTNANVLFVDQPVGTGFSYADYEDDYVKNENQVAQDMYEFLQTFYQQYPQYQSNDFFVTGESYAGHYVPSVSYRIFEAMESGEGPFNIPLKGFAIGNGLTNPLIQYNYYASFAYDNNLITKKQYDSLESYLVPTCIKQLKNNGPLKSFFCQSIVSKVLGWAGDINIYDIRKKCVGSLCYDMSHVDDLMARDDVKKSLGINPRSKWAECNNKVHEYLNDDWWLNCEANIPAMLKGGIRALVYAGKEDFICNWYGNKAWVAEMEWYGHDDYNKQTMQDWIVDGNVAGQYQSYGPLTFLGVNKAGHMVPMDQPTNALDMLNRFMAGNPFGETIIIN